MPGSGIITLNREEIFMVKLNIDTGVEEFEINGG